MDSKYFKCPIDLRKITGLTDLKVEEIAEEANITVWTLRNNSRILLFELKDLILEL